LLAPGGPALGKIPHGDITRTSSQVKTIERAVSGTRGEGKPNLEIKMDYVDVKLYKDFPQRGPTKELKGRSSRVEGTRKK